MIKVTETELKGCYILEPQIFKDERGHFFESFNHKDFVGAIGEEVNYVQDNQSFSKRGVLRGLHFQKGEHAHAELVRVLEGTVFDVAVDLRKDPATFGQHGSSELSGENNKHLLDPRGFAHDFMVLLVRANFFY